MDENLNIMNKEIVKIKNHLIESIQNYKDCIDNFSYDVPIQVLCLPQNIQNILFRNNIFRVNDIRNTDLGKIKGLGDKKISIILLTRS